MTDGALTHQDSVASHMLRAAACGAPIPSEITSRERGIAWLIRSGLGPLLCHLLRESGIEEGILPASLRGAELTAKMQAGDLADNLAFVGSCLDAASISAVAMKGVGLAHRAYPAPHLRVMRDIDLLVPPGERKHAEAVLLEHGFVRGEGYTEEAYRDHHHAAPLQHRTREMWVEVHSALLPNAAFAAREAPFNYSTTADVSVACEGVPGLSYCLRPPVELALIATAWCRDLGDDFGDAGLQRRLFDAIFLLRAASDIDLDALQRWSANTLTGKSLLTLLTYLRHHDALPAGVEPESLGLANRYFNDRLNGRVQRLLDRELLADVRTRGWLSDAVIGSVLSGWLDARAPWRALLETPINIAFPRQNAERFDPRYQLRRLGSLRRRL